MRPALWRGQMLGCSTRERCGIERPGCRGAGSALVQAALARAEARPEVRLVTLTVTEGNARAIGLYERCGFRAFGLEPMAIATPEGYKAKVHMWLPIGGTAAA